MIQFGAGPKLLQFILAPVLVLWMAGAGCVFGCEPIKPSEIDRTLALDGGPVMCEAHTVDPCCPRKSKGRSLRRREGLVAETQAWRPGEPTAKGIRRCPMGIRSNAASSLGRLPDVGPALIRPLLLAPNFGERFTGPANLYPVLNRGSTHLVCCVFLI